MTGTRDRTKTKNNKKMTKKWQKNDRDKWQDKKKRQKQMTKNDNANDKIIIFMYPSVWLQVPSNDTRMRFWQRTSWDFQIPSTVQDLLEFFLSSLLGHLRSLSCLPYHKASGMLKNATPNDQCITPTWSHPNVKTPT